MEHEHFTYPEAIKYLARKYNIEIKDEEQTAERIEEQQEKSLFYGQRFCFQILYP